MKKEILTILLVVIFSTLSSQTVKNATHYFYYEKHNEFKSDSLLIHATTDLTNFNDSIKKYYKIEFNNYLNHILEILIYENDTFGILTNIYYEIEEAKLSKYEKKSIKGRKIKKYNYSIINDTTLITGFRLRKLVEALERANFESDFKRDENTFTICEGKLNFNFFVKEGSIITKLNVNKACLDKFELSDNLITVVYLLLYYTEHHNLSNINIDINKMFKANLNENYACVKLKKKRRICKQIY